MIIKRLFGCWVEGSFMGKLLEGDMRKKVRLECPSGRGVEIIELYGRRGTLSRRWLSDGIIESGSEEEVSIPSHFCPNIHNNGAWDEAAREAPEGGTFVKPEDLVIRWEERGK